MQTQDRLLNSVMIQQLTGLAGILAGNHTAFLQSADSTVSDILKIPDWRSDNEESSWQLPSISLSEFLPKETILVDPKSYIWQPPESDRIVHLSFDVIDGILQDVLRGFSLVPKRGAEVGGILLGKIEGNVVTIDDFVAVPCHYRKGPSYLLTEDDSRLFQEEWNRAGSRAIGYYRSDTRTAMSIGEEDRHLISRFFPDPDMPVLLIRPFATKVSHAGFFFRKDGRFPEQTPLGFSFSRKLLGGGSRPRSTAPAETSSPQSTEPVAPTPPVPPEKPEPEFIPVSGSFLSHPPPKSSPSAPRSRGKETWIAAIFLCIALGWAGGYYTARQVTPTKDPKVYQLSLQIDPQLNSFRISWNNNASAIRLATHGQLQIQDQGNEKTYPLDLAQLRLGHVVYATENPSITATLDIEVAGSILSKTVQFTKPAAPEVGKK